jgi:hypothetical protein
VRPERLFFTVCVGAMLAWPPAAAAQPSALSAAVTSAESAVSAPVPPEVIAREDGGRVVVRATRVVEGPVIDGRLDDPVYQTVQSFGEFIQQEPREGQPATERTEAWILYDDSTIYVSARCWQDPALRVVANDRRRDGENVFRNDNFGVILDTFRDRRNGLLFQTNPVGAVAEQQMTDEGAGFNRDWNTVWDVRTGRFDGGWTVEMAIPFKSLRYAPGRQQVWGINMRRAVQSKSELSYLTAIPAASGRRGLARVSMAATLVGLEVPQSTRRIEVKPFGISSVATDRDPEFLKDNEFSAKTGFDAKIGVGRGLVADLTVNTDFAQVEEDDAQVNLTRFSLFFPEKRDFFLEGQGIFAFGGSGGRGPGFGGPSDTPVLFFSRRIGLEDENQIGIDFGGRVTGKAGPYSIGLLQIRQEASPHDALPVTDFTVARLRRDVFRRSSVGLIATHRSHSVGGQGSNQVVGVDGYFAPQQDLTINTYFAKSFTPGRNGDDLSYRAQLDYSGDRYGLQLEHLGVGGDFNPEVGFLRREDFKRNYAQVRFSPRPAASRHVLKYGVEASVDYITDNDFRLESQQLQAQARVELLNGDQVELEAEDAVEVLDEGFEVTEELLVPVGSYRFSTVRANYELGSRRRLTGRISASRGGFYGGTRTETRYRGRIEVSSSVSLEPTVGFNWIDIPQGQTTVKLFGSRATWTLTPRMLASALVQYNSQDSALSTSLRFRWEYRPGSEFFFVYTDGRDTTGPGGPRLENRSLAVKITRLVRF